MIRKLIWLFVGYVVLRTVAPDVAAALVGIAIASIVTAINLVGPVVASVIAQFSGQDVTNATAAILLTLGVLLALYVWGPATRRLKRVARR